jgi:hypothetical protein
MAALVTQRIVLPSATPTLTAAAGGGDTATPGDASFLVVKNASGSPVNVTLAAYPDVTEYGAAIPDLIVAVPATTGERWIGPLRGSIFGATVAITYSSATSVTVGVFTT